MTKTKNKSTNSNFGQKTIPWYQRAWAIAIFVIVGIALIVTLIICLVKPNDSRTQEDKATSTLVPNDKKPTPDKPIESEKNSDDEDGPEKTIQFEAENPNRQEDLSGFITYVFQDDANLRINATISQYLDTETTCTLHLKGENTGHTFSTTVRAYADVSNSNCEEFVIPTTELVPDSYQIVIELSTPDQHGTIRPENIKAQILER